MDNFPWRRKFPGGEFFRENFHCGEFPEFLYEILLMSCFLIADLNFRRGKLRVIIRGKF